MAITILGESGVRSARNLLDESFAAISAAVWSRSLVVSSVLRGGAEQPTSDPTLRAQRTNMVALAWVME
jgi:hypothetical protein